MKSPKLLFLRWVGWLGTLVRFGPFEDSGTIRKASRELDASELVARFIHSKSQLSKSHGKPKRTAFDQSPHNELSVVHSTGLPDRDLWQIGMQTLVDQPGRDKIHGRADIPVKSLIERKLRAIRDDNPFQRHTSVVGWPDSSNADERKQQRTLICLELSQDPDIKLAIPESPIVRFAD